MRRVTLLLAVSLLSTRCATSSEAPGTSVGRAAGPTSSNAQATLAQGEAALKRSDWKSAEALLTQAEREDPRSARASALLATAIFHQARWADALAAAQRSLAKGETFEARLVEGRVLAAQRKFEGAIASFERCTVLDPGSADAWSALSGARLAVGEQAGAERAYAEVAKRLPRIEAEDHIWTDILRMQPDPLQIQEALDRCARGTAAYMAGQYPEARYEQVVVLGTVPQYGHCWSELGKTSWKLGKLDDAEQYFRRALASYRPDLGGLKADTEGLLAALLLERGGDAAEAVKLARASIAVRGERPATVETLARACEAAKDRTCARDTYAKLAKAPGAPDALRARAEEKLKALSD